MLAIKTNDAKLSVIPTSSNSATHVLPARERIIRRYLFYDGQLAIGSGVVDRRKYSRSDSASVDIVIFVVGSSTLVSTTWEMRASELKRSTAQTIRGLPAL